MTTTIVPTGQSGQACPAGQVPDNHVYGLASLVVKRLSARPLTQADTLSGFFRTTGFCTIPDKIPPPFIRGGCPVVRCPARAPDRKTHLLTGMGLIDA